MDPTAAYPPRRRWLQFSLRSLLLVMLLVRGKLERVLPGGVRFTGSLDEARTTIRAEIKRGADLIVLGGGDGTVVMGLTLLGEACRAMGRREPAIGILRLGSGNAIAETARLPFLRPYPAGVNIAETRTGAYLRSVEIAGPFDPTGPGNSESAACVRRQRDRRHRLPRAWHSVRIPCRCEASRPGSGARPSH